MNATDSQKPLCLKQDDHNLELEIKYLTDRQTMEKLLHFIEEQGPPFIPEPVARDERVNIYYDTRKKFHLYRRGVECRSREKNPASAHSKGFKYDLKTPLDLGNPQFSPASDGILYRREYSGKGAQETPSLSQFGTGTLKGYLSTIHNKTLVPWVKGHFTRSRFNFAPTGHPDAVIEIAFETGYFTDCDETAKSDPLYIIEMELKKGTIDALRAASQALDERYPGCLKTGTQTKGAMGLAWIQGIMDKGVQKRFADATAWRAIRGSGSSSPPPLRQPDL